MGFILRWNLASCAATNDEIFHYVTGAKAGKPGAEILRLARGVCLEPPGGRGLYRPLIDAVAYFNPVARIHRVDSDRDIDFSARPNDLFGSGDPSASKNFSGLAPS